MLSSYFSNYEKLKLAVADPTLINLYIWLLILGITALSIKKQKTVFLDVTQTDQLRGIAILFIVVGHLWVHVSFEKPSIILSGDGVSLFFVLSGFGLTRSHLRKPYSIRKFVSKRFSRLFIPYWIVTILILTLDYVLLKRTYGSKDILMTFLGINVDEATKHIDYARWFITCLIFWYAIFLLALKQKSYRRFLMCIGTASIVVFLFDYYVTKFGWYNIFSFFFGCFLGIHYDAVHDVAQNKRTLTAIICILGLILALSFDLFLKDLLITRLPYLGILLAGEIKSIIFSFSVMIAVYFLCSIGVTSRFLAFIGTLSYEIFLLHGAFLIKYNFFFTNKYLPLTFAVYLAFIILLSFSLSKISDRLNLGNIPRWLQTRVG